MAMAIGPAIPGVAPTMIPSRNPERIITSVTEMESPKMENSSGPWNTARMPIQI